ncbi:hypothetical protein D1872_80130 [compost metagenome]
MESFFKFSSSSFATSGKAFSNTFLTSDYTFFFNTFQITKVPPPIFKLPRLLAALQNYVVTIQATQQLCICLLTSLELEYYLIPNITFPAFALNGDFTAIFALENYLRIAKCLKINVMMKSVNITK